MTVNLQSAFRSLREQWQRALLSALGIMVGSVAVVLLVSIATGVREDVTQEVKGLGVNVLIVMPTRIIAGDFNPNIGGQSFLDEKQAEDLKQIEGVLRVAPITFAGAGIGYKDKEAYPITMATTADWFIMRPVDLQEGRTFTEDERTQPVCVIGSIAKEELFGTEPALGKTITYSSREYKVVGVTQDVRSENSLFSMGGFENAIYFPYHEIKSHSPDMQIDRLMVQSLPEAEPKQLVQEMERVMLTHVDRQQFSVLTQEDLLGLVYKLMSILTWLLTGLTSIALFVGGVGIMAVMLMSVSERAKEIGVRKTLGARKVDIFTQFLAEAALLGTMGGLAGLAFSYVVCLALLEYTPIKPMITPAIILLSFAVSTGIGTVFGLIPALNAARKDPVVALRSE